MARASTRMMLLFSLMPLLTVVVSLSLEQEGTNLQVEKVGVGANVGEGAPNEKAVPDAPVPLLNATAEEKQNRRHLRISNCVSRNNGCSNCRCGGMDRRGCSAICNYYNYERYRCYDYYCSCSYYHNGGGGNTGNAGISSSQEDDGNGDNGDD